MKSERDARLDTLAEWLRAYGPKGGDVAADEIESIRAQLAEQRARADRLLAAIWRAHAHLDLHGGDGVPVAMGMLARAANLTQPAGPAEDIDSVRRAIVSEGGAS